MKRLRIILIIVLSVACAASAAWVVALGIQLMQAKEDYRYAESVAGIDADTIDVTDTTDTVTTEALTTDTEIVTAPESLAPLDTESDTAETAHTPPETSKAPEKEPTSDDPRKLQIKINLKALRSINPDVEGWITIPGTGLSYPIMQGKNNDYYLKRTWKGTYSAAGAVFLDYRNSPTMNDFHSIIYGHRMSDGTMFTSLRHYADQSYFEAHPFIYIVTDKGTLCYEVFAAYEADAINGSTYRLGLKDDAGQQAYIDYCTARSVIKTNAVPEPGDHIITLSTCVSMEALYDTRWVVQAVRKP